MDTTYLNAIAAYGGTLVAFAGLVDSDGVEIATAGYARQAVSWGTPVDGRIELSADATFAILQGTTIAGWRGFSVVSGGTAYGGAALESAFFMEDGSYVLKAGFTYIDHSSLG